MGFLLTDEQRAEIEFAGLASLPAKLTQILAANHARVLDFFREVDTNFDGCISRGEMQFAMFKLGLGTSPKEVDQLFDALDPDGNQVIEFHEMQTALREAADGTLARRRAARVQKPLTPAQQRKADSANRHAHNELKEMIYEFERQRGLTEPGERRPPSAAMLRDQERMEKLQAEVRRARARKSMAVPRGEMMSRMDSIHVKSKLLRPQTAPSRLNAEETAARRKQAVYEYWLNQHRAEIDSHARAVAKEYEDDKRIRQQRVQLRRDRLLETMRSKQASSRLAALDRHEPFPIQREVRAYRSTYETRQRERAWSQDIIFLPPAVARRDKQLCKERAAADYLEGVNSVRALPLS
jgi:hypothetical protein